MSQLSFTRTAYAIVVPSGDNDGVVSSPARSVIRVNASYCAASGVDARGHYEMFGRLEGRDPNAFFSTSWYLSLNQDVRASGANPLDHYHQVGFALGLDPSAAFDTTLYLQHNPDVAAAHVDPLQHFLESGQFEGRIAFPAIGSNIVNGFDAEFYVTCRRHPLSRYVYSTLVSGSVPPDWGIHREWSARGSIDTLLEELERARPELILDSRTRLSGTVSGRPCTRPWLRACRRCPSTPARPSRP